MFLSTSKLLLPNIQYTDYWFSVYYHIYYNVYSYLCDDNFILQIFKQKCYTLIFICPCSRCSSAEKMALWTSTGNGPRIKRDLARLQENTGLVSPAFRNYFHFPSFFYFFFVCVFFHVLLSWWYFNKQYYCIRASQSFYRWSDHVSRELQKLVERIFFASPLSS